MKQILKTNVLFSSTVAGVTLLATLCATFILLEPTISRAVDSTPFTVRQQITDEISFTVPPANVSMTGAIQGITGGSATGTTYAVVRTNSIGGYHMSIAFTGSPAMRGDVSGNTSIRDFTGAEPSYDFTASSAALFAYNVATASTTDVDPSFLNSGATCNAGSVSTPDKCWKGASTTAFRIVDRKNSAADGATTTIKFVIRVPNVPSPTLTQDYYTATATLTALNQ